MKRKNFKKGDTVVMHDCMEATVHKDQVLECKVDSFMNHGDEVVFFKDISGYWGCEFLTKVEEDGKENDD